MGKLTRRLERLERQRPPADICPEHRALTGVWPVDYRDGLEAFSPDPAERAAYHARQDQLETQPPCTCCGWRPFVVRVQVSDHWGQHGEPVA